MYRRMAASLGVLAVLSAAACGGETSDETGGPGRAESVTIAISADEGTLTPFTNKTGYPGDNLVELMFDSLVIEQGDEVVPLLAEDVKTSDNRVFTMPLRSGVTWHDGEPLTAADVKFSVEFYRDHMEGDSAIDVSPITKVAVDGTTVTMTLDAPDPEFPRRILSDMSILPQHLWSSVTEVSEAGTELAIGSGPYELDSYDAESGYTLTANDAYYLGEPKVQTINVVVIPQESTQFAALRPGEIDMSTRIVPPQQMESLDQDPNIAIAEGTEFASTLLLFNNDRPPFDRPEVRRALAMAIDVADLVDTALLGQGTTGNPGFLHPKSPVKGEQLEPLYNTDEANRLLDDLGAAPGEDGIRVLDGEPMSYELLVYSTSTDRLRSADLIRDMLGQVGVEVKVTSLDVDSLDAKVWPDYDVRQGRNYDMSMWGWSAPVMLSSGYIAQLLASDPDVGSLNVVGFDDSAADAAIEDMTSEPSMPGRIEAAGQLQDQIVDQMPFLTLYYRNGAYAFREDVYDGWTWQDGQSLLHKASFVDLEVG